MNIFKKIIYMLGIGAVMFTAASCSDPDDELTSVEYDRLFSPTALEARIQNRTNVRLSWECLSTPDSYTIELFANDEEMACEGTADLSFTGVTENPYTITGLEGETTYSVRIKGVAEGQNDSKWTVTTFETDTEQSLETVTEDDLTYQSVTLRWPAGTTATSIELTSETAASVSHTVTSAEIEAGAATIEGLESETTYTAVLMNGTKTRGTMTFTTLINLDGATPVTVDDDFEAMLEAAEEGTTFAFYPGTYTAAVNESGNVGTINITKSISIKAVRPSDRPILNARISLEEGASLTISQVVLTGENTDGGQAFTFNTATTYGSLNIEDCEIYNFNKGFYYVNVAAEIDEISINNCLIHDITCDGGDLFDCRAGYIKALNITNSTIWNSCASRDFIRYDNAADNFNVTTTPTITVDHCTIDGVSNNSSRRLLYVRFTGNTTVFTNNIVSNSPDCGRGFSDNSATNAPTFSNNNYYNTANFVSSDGGTARFYDSEGTTLDPGYADAANGDFTLSNEDLIFYQIGDPRWY